MSLFDEIRIIEQPSGPTVYDDLLKSTPLFYNAKGELIATSKKEYKRYVECKRYGVQWPDLAHKHSSLVRLGQMKAKGLRPKIKTRRVKGSCMK